MVFFTCNNCGESVKKAAVEKHYLTKCRGGAKNVSCMDCQKDFRGEEYVAHTQCISEAEKYSAKGFVSKRPKNKNAQKQESWMEIIRAILQNSKYKLNQRTRQALEHLKDNANVPRKKDKFENYATKCLRMSKMTTQEVWKVLEQELDRMRQEKEAEKQQQEEQKEAVKRPAETNGGEEEPGKKKKKSKEQAEVNEGEEEPAKKNKEELEKQEEEEEVAEEFNWQAVLEKVARKQGQEEGVLLEKMKQKVLKKYQAKLGLTDMDEKQQKKFHKKFSKELKRCSSLVQEDDVVKMIST